MRLRILVGRNDLLRYLQLRRKGSECPMNGLDLDRVNAAHAVEAQGARGFAPAQQAVGIGDVALNQIYRLNMRRMGSIYQSHASVKRLRAPRRFRDTEIRCVVLQSNSQPGDAV